MGSAGWGWGCVSAIDSNGRTIWIPCRESSLKSSAKASDPKQNIKKNASVFISEVELKGNPEASESRNGLKVEAILTAL
jgi:hypothetical protein